MSRSDAHDLTARLADMLRREHAAMADFIVALADFDRRRLWLDLGYPGLFLFLHRELGLSKGAAHFRKVAAELVQRFPDVVEPLRDGRLCLSSVVELARVATRENLPEVLPRFFHRSCREAREVAVEISPAAVVPRREVTTAVEAPARAAAPDGPGAATPVQAVELQLPVKAVPLSPVAERPRDVSEPLTADLRRLHVTVSRRFLAKLEEARSALSHLHPGAGAEEILEAGLDLILAAHARRKGMVTKPRKEARPSGPGHIPARVKREVWMRDQGRCQWPIAGKDGGICGSTLRVEFDHRVPRARDGPSSVEGVRLLCAFHNNLAARQVFGDRWMDRYSRSARR
ncbi:MAG TPA: HNH endonuclease signature motif containing protein [Anaeromyxobacteraceae bacterium]|nr:HNH endonuclease signature motif containing protein [Anaeromyxobacteraceae bacterium]